MSPWVSDQVGALSYATLRLMVIDVPMTISIRCIRSYAYQEWAQCHGHVRALYLVVTGMVPTEAYYVLGEFLPVVVFPSIAHHGKKSLFITRSYFFVGCFFGSQVSFRRGMLRTSRRSSLAR